jgi:hypothetical protein
MLPKESPKTYNPQWSRNLEGHTNWHWLIKHPVEFSKNNHTPSKLAA